jgi:hypothetical protein
MNRNQDKGRLGPFVPLLKETLASPAWRAMSHGARSLYVSIKARYSSNLHNNGRLYVTHRQAFRELGSGFEEISRWFRELQHYGFIVQTKGGYLGVEGNGKAPHWRITECGYMKDLPTRDFMRWDGRKFRGNKKQNPATEFHSAPLRKSIAPLLRKSIAQDGTSATESHSISQTPPATESHSISRYTTPMPLSLSDYPS